MELTFDPAKSERNARERGLPFEMVRLFDFDAAVITPDRRHDYPEPRFVATGPIDGRVHVVCYTPTADGVRVISFRKANAREVARHDQDQDRS